MSTRLLMLIAATTVLGACRYHPSPVTLQGTPSDIAAIAGEWIGEYSSSETGRSGSISFIVAAGKDSAFGDVVMVPRGGQAMVAADAGGAHITHSTAPDVLRISFVRVIGGMVAGELEPYIAPDCQCVVHTVFQGMVKRNAIDGDYFTSGAPNLRQQGRWSVWRRVIASR